MTPCQRVFSLEHQVFSSQDQRSKEIPALRHVPPRLDCPQSALHEAQALAVKATRALTMFRHNICTCARQRVFLHLETPSGRLNIECEQKGAIVVIQESL